MATEQTVGDLYRGRRTYKVLLRPCYKQLVLANRTNTTGTKFIICAKNSSSNQVTANF